MIGRAFAGDPRYRERVVRYRQYTQDLDYSPCLGSIDFVFVDASHEREAVRHDSERALEMLAPGGVIVWDDYSWAHPGVVAALNELADGLDLVRLATTRLALYRDRRSAA